MRIDRDRLRIYTLAVVTGSISQIGLALAIYGTNSRALALLFFVEAVILGLVFGAGPGMAGAVVPWLFLYPVTIFAFDDQDAVFLFSAVLFMVIVLAFLAGMAGAMRDRYGGRSVPPPAA